MNTYLYIYHPKTALFTKISLIKVELPFFHRAVHIVISAKSHFFLGRRATAFRPKEHSLQVNS